MKHLVFVGKIVMKISQCETTLTVLHLFNNLYHLWFWNQTRHMRIDKYESWKHTIFFFFLLIIAVTFRKNPLFQTAMPYLWWDIPLLDSTTKLKRAKAALWTEWPARANPVHSTISPKKFAPDTYSNMPPTNRE